MFENIGGKIKLLAQILTWIGIIASTISFVVLVSIDDELFLIGLLVAVLGALFSWVSVFVLYGFGQLVENSDIIAQNTLKKQ